MGKQSAGLLVYSVENKTMEVFLVHPGGPFWAKKDKGVWSLPKGEFQDEDPLAAAKREFQEETGQAVPDGEYAPLGETKLKSGKTIFAWSVKGTVDADHIKSNTFEMEWPPRSGKTQTFGEVDRAGWFGLAQAAQKIHPSQLIFIERLSHTLHQELPPVPEQASLF